MEISTLYVFFHVFLFLIGVGFNLAKSQSPFIEASATYWLGVITLHALFAPITVALMLGYRLHGDV